MRIISGQIAFITGGAGGIGFALAEALGARGVHIMIGDIEAGALEKAVEALRRKAIVANGVIVDVADRGSVANAAKVTAETYGKLHILCNNAGVITAGPVADLTDGDWNWIIDVNLRGIVHGLDAFLPLLTVHGEPGHIVNTASVAGLVSSPEYEPYHATKCAVVGLSECWAARLGPSGIGVSVLCPGLVPSGILASGRNRSGKYGSGSGAVSPAGAANAAAAVPARSIAERVIEGIEADELHLFTHEEYEPLIDGRFDNILAAFDRSLPGEADSAGYAGKTALVLCANAVGVNLARALGARGMNIVFADANPSRLADALDSLSEVNLTAKAHLTDLGAREGVESAARFAVGAFGKIHWLCNCSQITACENIDAAISINMKSAIHGVSVVVPLIEGHGEGGHVFNVASIHGLASLPACETFTATQYALIGMSEGWVQQFSDKRIGVSVLCAPSLPADKVDQALASIGEGEFYLFADDSGKALVEARYAALKAGFARARASKALSALPKRALPLM